MSQPRPIRVLIVEDAIDQAMFLRAMLQSAGEYEVEWSQDGTSALEAFERNDFDVVLTDLNLPGTDGFDLTREIRRISKVPVIAITGYTHQSYSESAYRAGVDALLSKPVEKAELVARLKEFLPDLHPDERDFIRVFALSARPGDVAAGCGGTLARLLELEVEALAFVLNPGSEVEAAAARSAAEVLGLRVIVANHSGDGDAALVERQLLLERIVREFDPTLAFVPSLGDAHPDRREAHRVSRVAFEGVPNVVAYATGTTTLDFRPTIFRDISGYAAQKVSALGAFQNLTGDRPDLTPRFAQASARWWGRFADWGEVEPFEVIRGEVPS